MQKYRDYTTEYVRVADLLGEYTKPQTLPLSLEKLSVLEPELTTESTSNNQIPPDPERRFRTMFTNEQIARLEKEFSKERFMSCQRRSTLGFELNIPPSTIKVWFQNRRMKDKRDRVAVTWPFKAIYSNRAFAASILQAAGVPPPCSCQPPPMVIPGMPPQLPGPSPYSNYRYNPYHMAPRMPSMHAPTAVPNLGYPTMPPQGYPQPPPMSNQYTPQYQMQSTSSSLSNMTVSPISSDYTRVVDRNIQFARQLYNTSAYPPPEMPAPEPPIPPPPPQAHATGAAQPMFFRPSKEGD